MNNLGLERKLEKKLKEDYKRLFDENDSLEDRYEKVKDFEHYFSIYLKLLEKLYKINKERKENIFTNL